MGYTGVLEVDVVKERVEEFEHQTVYVPISSYQSATLLPVVLIRGIEYTDKIRNISLIL